MLSPNIKNNLPDGDLFITRKRKKYKFAKFDEMANCFQAEEWAEKSPNLSSFVLEIGAGTGLFSVELARRHPEKLYVAMDIKSDRLYTGAKLAQELGLENIAFVRSDIWRIGELFPENSVAEIWITFPDPYANEDQTKLKKSDAKHRLTHPRFLEIYKGLLASSAVLHFKTDNQPLFDWSKEQFEQNGWKIIEITDDLHGEHGFRIESGMTASEIPEDHKVMTSYEKRFDAEGLPIHLLSATVIPGLTRNPEKQASMVKSTTGMMVRDENELIELGQKFGAGLRGGEVIELAGDIGAGKTTFTKGIAQALGVQEDVNSPSFTIMKEYEANIHDSHVWLKHYDFYRLDDAGLMKDEIADSIGDVQVITVVEWAKDVAGVLPENRHKVEIKYLPDSDGREVVIANEARQSRKDEQ